MAGSRDKKSMEYMYSWGDFNMSLFKVVPELRSHGIEATLVSWFPWRAPETTDILVDSCGIFMLVAADVNVSVQADIWAADIWSKLPVIPKNAGPGQTLQTYLPKHGDLAKKLKDSLEPLPMSIQEGDETAEEAAAVAGRVKDNLTVKGKTLDTTVWMYKGKNHKGSHFPLACWTNNPGRRGEEAYIRRADKHRWKERGPWPQ